jgi:glycosyltransferase
MSKKKVLMVHNFYQIGGGEHTVFKNEVEMLRENGHEVIEYTRSNDELKKSKWKMLLLPFTTIWSFKTYREVKKIIKEQSIDIVHCHNTFPLISPSVYYAARNRRIPVVQTIHNFRFLCPGAMFYRNGKICEECREKQSLKPALKNKCYRNSKIQTLVVIAMLKIHKRLETYKKINYIFLTEFNKMKFDHLINVNGNNVFVKPNFVKEIQVKGRKSCKTKTFVFAGRLEENKGIKYLLSQWKNMAEDYQLHIYGTGPLEKYVKENSCDKKNIKFYGFQSQQVIFNDLKSAMGMIFPSLWYEGFPMIIAESMAIGCPVISTNIGNENDIIISSNGGVTFNIDENESFELAVEKCICDNDELSLNAQKFYEKVLTRDKNYECLNKIYENVKI